jgi:hypothetical protein
LEEEIPLKARLSAPGGREETQMSLEL